jgi:hypothetical protein
MTVSLKDFISQTLRDILGAITEVQEDEKIGKYIAPWGIGAIEYPADSGAIRKGPFTATVIKFDVGVTAELTDAAKAGGGLKVAVFNLGVHGEMGSKDSATNRIQFSIPINIPPGDGDPASYSSESIRTQAR